jgi:hypothetical protein
MVMAKEKTVKKKAAKKKKEAEDLVGIDAIFDFLGGDLSHATLLELTFHWDFPMEKREPENVWVANPKKIKKWLKQRNTTPKTLNMNVLRKYEMQELRASGQTKLFNKTTRGVAQIADFFDLSQPKVFELWRDFVDCPIRKCENGELETDADEFQIFLEGLGIKLAPEISPGRSVEDGWRYGR